ncbi:MAG TPA: HlyD family efflux transporter periplasmic adaptor subunit [Solirubrobacteraceae bacterium]|nr:HlyD family efflux transporter periplasmic adaptor subunit [Solirubrobacteraceae bacterium]
MSPAGEWGPHERNDVLGKFKEQPLLNTALLGLCIALAVAAYIVTGPPSQSSGRATRTTTVKRGVVQSTVSGSGNIQSASQLNLGFKTSGTVTHIYVKPGQQVAQGQLLATLDPKGAEVTSEQAKATLKSSEASLAQLEEHEGETSAGQGSSATSPSGSTATAATATTASTAKYTAYAPATGASAPARAQAATTTPGQTSAPPTTTGTSSTPTTTTRKTTPNTTTKSSHPTSGSRGGGSTKSSTSAKSSSPAQTATTAQGTSSSTKQSAATREANLASARAAVRSDKLTVESDEQAVQNTKLTAPEDGTIVSLSGEVGETVSGTGTTRGSSSTGSSPSSTSSAGATGGKSGSPSGSSSSGSSSASQGSSGSSSFAVLNNLESLQVVVALSESEIGSVREGQIATVTVEALNGRKVAAHVVSVSQVPTSSSGAVSYDVTFQLDQGAEGLKVGMSATAEVVVKQSEGVSVPTSAIKGGSVTVVRGGKRVTQPVTTGLAGDSSTIILSGLNVGEEIVLPTTSTSGASLSSRLGSRAGRGGGLGGALGGGGGGFSGGGIVVGGGRPPGG